MGYLLFAFTVLYCLYMPYTVRLSINEKLEEGMAFLQERYPFMTPDEILKLALSRFYREELDASEKK
jgi:hypothetical protein